MKVRGRGEGEAVGRSAWRENWLLGVLSVG